MSFKTIDEKVKFLNKIVKGTLGITHFSEWELSSYMNNSVFRCEGSIGHVHAKGFEECIDKAIQFVWGKIANG